MPTLVVAPQARPRHWRWVAAFGVALVALGVFALGLVAATTVVSVVTFGIVLAVGGGLGILNAFRERKEWSGFGLHLVTAVLYLVAGGYMVANPLVMSVALTLMIGVFLLLSGFARIVYALFTPRFPYRWLVLLTGVPSAVLGVMILAGWPESALWVIGLFVSIELVVNGAGFLMLGLAARPRGRPDIPGAQPLGA